MTQNHVGEANSESIEQQCTRSAARRLVKSPGPSRPSGPGARKALARTGSPRISRWLLPDKASEPRLMSVAQKGFTTLFAP